MKSLPRYLKIMIGAATLSILLIILLIKFIAPSLLEKQIQAKIIEACGNCVFTSGKFHLGLLPPQVIFERAHFRSGDPKSTLFEIHIEKIILKVSTKKLLSHVLKLKQIVIEKPDVVVTEGDLKSPSSPTEESRSPWQLEIDHIDIKNGNFSYNREHRGKVGTIHVQSISGNVGELGSTPARKDQPVTAHIKAILEQTGKINLTVIPIPFSKETHLDMSLELSDVNLDETNQFFVPNDGIKINGIISLLESEVSIRGPSLHAQVGVDYHGLSVHFAKTSERSWMTALLSNLLSGVKITKDRSRSATIKRKPDEPPVGFIARGMKSAMLKVATD